MQKQTERATSPGIDCFPGPGSEPDALFPPEMMAEVVSIGGKTEDCYDEPLGGAQLHHGMSLGVNSGSSTVDGNPADAVESEITIDPELQALLTEFISQLMGYHISSNPTNPASISSVTRASSQLPSSESPPANPHLAPTIPLENQSYPCSWRPEGSDVQCNYVAPNRSALLRHLGATHQVSGAPNAPVICHLTDSALGSACEAQIKRGNFPRHVDTHYPVRYHCPYCPVDTSFSRKDSWKKHVNDKHI